MIHSGSVKIIPSLSFAINPVALMHTKEDRLHWKLVRICGCPQAELLDIRGRRVGLLDLLKKNAKNISQKENSVKMQCK